MNSNTRRLILPTGDFFDLPMPRDGGRFVQKPQLLGAVVATDIIIPVAIGLAIGGIAAFALYKAFK